jgi:hypothetical protein
VGRLAPAPIGVVAGLLGQQRRVVLAEVDEAVGVAARRVEAVGVEAVGLGHATHATGRRPRASRRRW